MNKLDYLGKGLFLVLLFFSNFRFNNIWYLDVLYFFSLCVILINVESILVKNLN